jgi:hypothetical protein
MPPADELCMRDDIEPGPTGPLPVAATRAVTLGHAPGSRPVGKAAA